MNKAAAAGRARLRAFAAGGAVFQHRTSAGIEMAAKAFSSGAIRNELASEDAGRSSLALSAPEPSVHDPRLPPPRQPGRPRGSWPRLFTRILTVAAGALVLVGAVAISFVVFVIVLAALLVIGVYLWWKTRHFRRQLAEQLNAQRAGAPPGEIIEGEVIRKRESDTQ